MSRRYRQSKILSGAEIYEKMANGSQVFNFKTLQAAIDNFNMRMETISIINQMQNKKIDFWYYNDPARGNEKPTVDGQYRAPEAAPIQWRFRQTRGTPFQAITKLETPRLDLTAVVLGVYCYVSCHKSTGAGKI